MDSNNVCDSCKFLDLIPDPDPNDWFCDDDMRAYCKSQKMNISVKLRPYETKNIQKPLWCPFLGRELTEQEKRFLETLKILQKQNKT